jgi:uncharacterized RmlC-like cupin family protein
VSEVPPLRVISPAERQPDTASGAMLRMAAVSNALCGAERIWVGYVELGPGLVSAAHHHGEAESAIYIISGEARFYSGQGLAVRHEAGPGDFIWVAPGAVHIEMNAGQREPVRMIVARSTQDTLVFNVATPAGWIPS